MTIIMKFMRMLLIFICFIQIDLCAQSIQTHSIPKKIWLYTNSQTSLLKELNILNTKNFGSVQNYIVHQVNHESYSSHLSPQKVQMIENANKSIIAYFLNKNLSPQNSSKTTINNITQRLIIYTLLAQHGGVFIDQSVTLVEPLDSFFDFTLKKSQFVNGGHKIYEGAINYCIGFYNDLFSSLSEDLNLLNGNQNKWQFKPNVVQYPNIQDYFIACTKGNLLMQSLFETYAEILTKGKQWPNLSKINTNQKFIGMTNTHLVYEHAHLIASHWILQKQQSTLPKISPTSLAINTLGLITINSHLGPTKIKTQFSLDDYKIYQYLSKLTIEEIQLAVGRLHSLFRFNIGVNKIIEKKLMSFENSTEFWVENSFAHQFWIRHIQNLKDQQKYTKLWIIVSTFKIIKNSPLKQKGDLNKHTQIQSSPQVRKISFDSNKTKWQSLDKNIWIIWDNGVEGKSNLIVELCYENLKRSAQNSGFQIQAVSRSTVHNHLSKQMIQTIDKAIQNSSFDLSRQAVSDLWRMALVYENGGVYFDASTFNTNESFDWIVNIPQISQNLIWNRYGKQPDVFMLWNTFYGCPLEWQYDSENRTKSQWHLSYENNFIVASKGAELIKQWLDTMLQWIQLPYMETEKKMGEVGMIEHKWTWDSTWHFQSGRYLTAMDSLKYVIGRRQMLLKQQQPLQKTKKYINSAHYYKLWSIPGQFIGQQKLRGETNYENLDYRLSGYQKSYNTIYKYRFAQEYIEQILGPIEFQGKFFSRELAFMNKLVNDFYYQNSEKFTIQKLHELIHPQSLLGKALFNKDPKKTVELIKYYGSQAKMQRNLKGFSKVWTY